MKILVENAKHNEKYIFGHTENFLPVFIEKTPEKTNEMVNVVLISNHPEGLMGRVIL